MFFSLTSRNAEVPQYPEEGSAAPRRAVPQRPGGPTATSSLFFEKMLDKMFCAITLHIRVASGIMFSVT